MKNILQKCLDELNKENPRHDYVVGMLEVLIDSAPASSPIVTPTPSYVPPPQAEGYKPIIPMMENPPVVDAALIAKLKGQATIEQFPVLPNATVKK